MLTNGPNGLYHKSHYVEKLNGQNNDGGTNVSGVLLVCTLSWPTEQQPYGSVVRGGQTFLRLFACTSRDLLSMVLNVHKGK